jgi:hypothetical protein
LIKAGLCLENMRTPRPAPGPERIVESEADHNIGKGVVFPRDVEACEGRNVELRPKSAAGRVRRDFSLRGRFTEKDDFATDSATFARNRRGGDVRFRRDHVVDGMNRDGNRNRFNRLIRCGSRRDGDSGDWFLDGWRGFDLRTRHALKGVAAHRWRRVSCRLSRGWNDNCRGRREIFTTVEENKRCRANDTHRKSGQVS